MVDISVTSVWSAGPVTHRQNLRDLDVVHSSNGPVLYGTNGSSGGIVSFLIDTSTGALTYSDARTLPPLASVDGPAHLERMSIGGQDFMVNLGRHADGVEGLQVAPDGSLATRMDLGGTDGLQISTLAFHDAGTRDVVYAGYWGRSDIGIYQVTSGGALSFLGQINSPFDVLGADIVDFRIADVGGQDVLVFASRYHDLVYSYTINDNGGLAAGDVLRMSDGLPISTPSAMEIAVVGETTFAVLASAGTSSLTVMEIDASGGLTPRDHINASTATRIETLSAMDTITVGDRAFVVAGGANDGVSLFEVMPDGRLYHWGAQEDTAGSALQNITSVTAVARGAGFDIYAGSESEAGITQLRVDIGTLGTPQLGTAGDDTLLGGAGGDVIFGGEGNDSLRGNDGNDVLIGGTGTNRMEGGDGADLFILSPDATRDTIMDFEVGVDQIDFSGLGRLYDLSALTWSERSVGAVVSFGDRYTIIYSSDRTPLSKDSFTSQSAFNLTHTDLSYMTGGTDPGGDFSEPGSIEGSAGADTLYGSANDDEIMGNLGDDRLLGGGGDDVLNGGAGADHMDGGDGNDWVSYDGSRGSLRVDLMFAQINTNVAAGDSYASIENLIGSQGFDNLRGTLGDNHIKGERNVDYIFGRRGNDTLEGGVGDDVLFGGVGADVLIGGVNRDRAQYSEALTAVVVDLQAPSRNTGEAAGDSFDSIEDLAGGRFGDTLYGNESANRLFGREGTDLLIGREGNDYLNGGANEDTLDGGAGNDVMRGGNSADVFVFRQGVDAVEDFNTHVDILRLDADLLGGTATASRALEFASVVGNNVVFDFDTGDQLVLQNVGSLAGLEDDFQFF